jgi:hypothetical protein
MSSNDDQLGVTSTCDDGGLKIHARIIYGLMHESQ